MIAMKAVRTNKEGSSKRIHRDESDLQKLAICFESVLMTNSFSEVVDQLLNIASGVVLPTDIAERLVKSTTSGRPQMNEFIQKRLN